MERICLDSDVALEFLRGDRATVEKLQHYANREEICIHPLTAVELGSSIRKKDVMDNLLHTITILPIDKKTAQVTIQLLQDLRERGFRPSLFAVYTAAICLAHNAFLFTKDRSKFEGIKGLKLV